MTLSPSEVERVQRARQLLGAAIASIRRRMKRAGAAGRYRGMLRTLVHVDIVLLGCVLDVRELTEGAPVDD